MLEDRGDFSDLEPSNVGKLELIWAWRDKNSTPKLWSFHRTWKHDHNLFWVTSARPTIGDTKDLGPRPWSTLDAPCWTGMPCCSLRCSRLMMDAPWVAPPKWHPTNPVVFFAPQFPYQMAMLWVYHGVLVCRICGECWTLLRVRGCQRLGCPQVLTRAQFRKSWLQTQTWPSVDWFQGKSTGNHRFSQ